jgi:hypothetical protein
MAWFANPRLPSRIGTASSTGCASDTLYVTTDHHTNTLHNHGFGKHCNYDLLLGGLVSKGGRAVYLLTWRK